MRPKPTLWHRFLLRAMPYRWLADRAWFRALVGGRWCQHPKTRRWHAVPFCPAAVDGLMRMFWGIPLGIAAEHKIACTCEVYPYPSLAEGGAA